MAAPDLSPYIPLPLFDRDATQLRQIALNNAALQFPGVTLTVGTLEVNLLDACALVVAEAGYAVDRLPYATTAGLLNLAGVGIDPGAPATATADFHMSSVGQTINAGTAVRYRAGDTSIVFTTDIDVIADSATSVISVPVTATAPGGTFNGLTPGTTLELLSVVPAVNSVSLSAAVAGGRDPEDATSWINRAVHRLQRLSSALVTPAHFEAYVLEQPGIVRAHAIDLYDPTTGNVNATGHVTVAIAGHGGAVLSTPTKTALQAAMAELAQANLAVHVIDTTVTTVNVAASVTRLGSYRPADVVLNVKASLAAFLNPDTWAWGASVTNADLVATIVRTPGVQSAVVSVPASTVVLAGVAPLATLGTATITVI